MGWNWSKKLRMMLWFRDSGVVLAFFYNFSYKNLSTGMEISRRGNHWQLIQVIGQAFSESWIDTWEFYKSTRQRLNISLSKFLRRGSMLCSCHTVVFRHYSWPRTAPLPVATCFNYPSNGQFRLFLCSRWREGLVVSLFTNQDDDRKHERWSSWWFHDVMFCSPS